MDQLWAIYEFLVLGLYYLLVVFLVKAYHTLISCAPNFNELGDNFVLIYC